MEKQRPLVPNPCHEDWDKLTPEERGHFCTVCETKVWDISSLTEAEAEEFLRNSEGDLCISYKESANGRRQHRPEPLVPLGRLVRRLPAAAGFSLALAACAPSGQDVEPAGSAAPSEPAPVAEPQEEPQPEPEPEPEAEAGADPEPTDEPPPAVEPEVERHVKGKWVPAEELDTREKPEKPVIKKGKFKRPG